MQQTSPVGNEPATDSDSRAVEKTGSTPTKAPEPTKVPSQNIPAQSTPTADAPAPNAPAPNTPAPNTPAPSAGDPVAGDPVAAVPGTPAPSVADPQQFPPTLVGMDPPTLSAAEGMKSPHRDVDAPADLPQFRPFPHPQRSEPGHPGLRRMWKRMLLFWRRTTI